jgi:hypothetical protein
MAKMMRFTKNVGCLQANGKTGLSIDVTTDCPKRRAGNACKYCYVEQSRKMGYNPKSIIESCPYHGEILKFSRDKVEFLNECGGIRLFSFGDYMPEHRDILRTILDDCQSIGLNVKAITKQVDFVQEFVNHPALRVIHLSIDNVGDGVEWNTAKSLRKMHSKVLIRCAVMRTDDVQAMEFSDIFTFNHAVGLKALGYRKFSKVEVSKYAETLGNRVCCTTGACFSCPVKCGKA